MRAVLDTNVVASGLLWAGLPQQLLYAAREQRLQLFTSPILLMELTDILSRRKFAHKLAAAQLSGQQLVERYAWLTTVVYPVAIVPTIIDDPDDDHVLACALSAKTEIIVSGDSHLLALCSFQSIQIITARAAIEQLGTRR